MKVGDEVILLVHGAGLVSEEERCIIEEIDDISLKLEDNDKIFVKNIKGNYITTSSIFGFWFEIKEKEDE